jgi:hypothetical protein
MSRAKIVEDATDEVKRRLGTLPEAEEVGKDVLILERGGKVTVTETVKHELGVTRFVTMPLRVPLSDASITQLSGARIPTVGEAIQRQSEIRTEQMARARELVVPAVHFRHDELACAMFMARDGLHVDRLGADPRRRAEGSGRVREADPGAGRHRRA